MLAAAQAHVEDMLNEHIPFEQIEREIENTDLTNGAKSALWLLAWTESAQDHRRHAVAELLAAEHD